MKSFISAILIVWLLLGCSDNGKSSSDILDKQKMTSVLWDIMRANSYTELFIKKDSLKDLMMENMKLQQQIFTVHKVSKEDFYKSYSYYASQPDQMRSILDSIGAKAERDRFKPYERNNRPILK
ncbi:MAG: DUF4296 domain-containing protein [Ferruginibacter sp.]